MAKSKSSGFSPKRFITWLNGENSGQRHSHPMDVSKFDGKSLQEIESRIRSLSHEELFVLDKNDKVIQAYKGNSKSVAFPRSVLAIEGATVTHGHPKGMAEFGGTFSFADVRNMADSKWSEHRATASGQGEMNYIMRRTSKSNGSGLKKRIESDAPSLQRHLSTTYSSVYNSQRKAGKSESQALHRARQEAVGELNAYWKKVMPQYGYEYVTRKRSYKYNR
nr:MAG TPA: hypothetical protein [Caudoviricetes sp.]